jgi:spermidine synthase
MPLFLAFVFGSGFSALLYQLIWQRALFTLFGVNIDSITTVVAAFMLGLGLGGLLGGKLSRLAKPSALLLFAMAELATGLFGLISLDLFKAAEEATLRESGILRFLLAFGLLIVPTMMMGASLPLLAGYLSRRSGNVGNSVGLFYFVNTLGAALACIAGARWLFGILGMADGVRLAACINIAIALGVPFLARRWNAETLASGLPSPAADGAKPLGFAVLLSGLFGYVSLSWEILWVRAFNWVGGGNALVFPFLLGFFLIGVAVGSRVASRRCSKPGLSFASLARLAALAGTAAFLVVPLAAWLQTAGLPARLMLLLPCLAAGLMGALLPLLCHLGVKADERAGSGIAWVYLANILGSTLGSLLTGFILMDVLSLKEISALLLLAAMAGAALLAWRAGMGRRMALPLIAMALLALLASPLLFDRLIERLSPPVRLASPHPVSQVIETRSGLIAVTEDGLVFGEGVYDGVLNTDLMHDVNGIIRPYLLPALHPSPKKVLLIGLGSGSWSQVVANLPGVERVTIVEINKGYERLVARAPAVASLLANPKVDIVVDDGRRWLKRHPERRFDLIITNTTLFWRAMATNLLSVEFLDLIRPHLKTGGIYFFNSTGSARAQRTAAERFPHALRLTTMMAVSEQPIEMSPARWRAALETMRIDGKPILDLSDPNQSARFESIMTFFAQRRAWDPADIWAAGYEERGQILERTRGLDLYTDDNMGDEWRLAASPAPR